MNPIRSAGIKVTLDKEREFKFSWAAIDYMTDKYESVGEVLDLVAQIADPMTITKKSKAAIICFFTALLIADDPTITPEIVSEILPLEKMRELAPIINKAVADGSIHPQ